MVVVIPELFRGAGMDAREAELVRHTETTYELRFEDPVRRQEFIVVLLDGYSVAVELQAKEKSAAAKEAAESTKNNRPSSAAPAVPVTAQAGAEQQAKQDAAMEAALVPFYERVISTEKQAHSELATLRKMLAGVHMQAQQLSTQLNAMALEPLTPGSSVPPTPTTNPEAASKSAFPF